MNSIEIEVHTKINNKNKLHFDKKVMHKKSCKSCFPI